LANHSLLPPTQQALEALYQLAAGVCQEILAFQPNLLISLAHSDMGPLYAAQIYWAQTQVRPFPACLRINLGVEKQDTYEQWRIANGMGGYDAQVSSKVDFYHLESWMSQHPRYQMELENMLSLLLPDQAPPQRILFLDEISHGTTRSMAFALLYGRYPQAELRFTAGTYDWTNALGEAWLHTFYASVWEDLQSKKNEQVLRRRFPTILHAALKQAVVGTENCEDDTLTWQPLQADNEAVQNLVAEGISVADCLNCSDWVRSQIEWYVMQRISGQQHPPKVEEDIKPWLQSWNFSAEDRLWIEIWIQDGVSTTRWAEICGVSQRQAQKTIMKEWQFYGNLQPSGFGTHTRYRVDPVFLPELSEEVVQSRSRFLQLCNGQILAHGYPGWSIVDDYILAERVDTIIDLTTTPSAPESERYWPNRNPDWFHQCYHDHFREEAARIGIQVTIHHFPIQPFCVAEVSYMVEILNTLDQAISEGKKIFVHDRVGNERTGLVLGCFLVRHGMEPKAAVQLLNQQLAQTFIQAYRTPGTEMQYRFILRWKTGQ
jgi:hypothetical protein